MSDLWMDVFLAALTGAATRTSTTPYAIVTHAASIATRAVEEIEKHRLDGHAAKRPRRRVDRAR